MKIELDGHMISSIVVQDLQGYYETMLNNPEEDGVCQAIERVLRDYMSATDYNLWIHKMGITGEASEDTDSIRPTP
jgi:hypothetical protein